MVQVDIGRNVSLFLDLSPRLIKTYACVSNTLHIIFLTGFQISLNFKCFIYNTIGCALSSNVELGPLLAEVEAVINAHPITYIFDDSKGVPFP